MKLTFKLNADQSDRARSAAEACLRFEQEHGYPLGESLVHYHFFDGAAASVIDALAEFQNGDGGFGKGLEVDIASPVSNPFAARLAMSFLLSLREQPPGPMLERLGAWLNSNQADDGDWHFAPQVYESDLAPWFARWTFPSLNPACCLTGAGHALGLLTQATLHRTARLFDRKTSPDRARTADFYNLLPYAEYLGSIEHPHRERFLDAIAGNIDTGIANNSYDDASHFFDHALGAGPDLVARIDPTAISAFADRLLSGQSDDGGWPNPYSAAWRPLASASAIVTLACLRDGV